MPPEKFEVKVEGLKLEPFTKEEAALIAQHPFIKEFHSRVDEDALRELMQYAIAPDIEPTRYDILYGGPPPKWYELPWLWIKGWWRR